MRDLTGLKVGHLTALRPDGRVSERDAHYAWICQCDCGNTTRVASNRLTGKQVTQSCGCALGTHGATKGGATHTYRIWLNMRDRCNNPRNKDYARYGGRGIGVDPAWGAYPQFLRDMGDRPPGRSLDRIDNDGPYSASNCRWATKETQMNNTAVARRISFGGRTMSLSQWARFLGMPVPTLHARLKKYGEDPALAAILGKEV